MHRLIKYHFLLNPVRLFRWGHSFNMQQRNLPLRLNCASILAPMDVLLLYEDENDNYNYEKGVFSTISFFWNDAKRLLTIGKRQGTYPGMPEERIFQIVIVKKGNGNGVELTGTPDKTLPYQGNEQVIQF